MARTKRAKPCFLVLESYWSENLTERDSVLPFLRGLCDLYRWESHYRTFDSANDLDLWTGQFNRLRRAGQEKIVYIASHGSSAGVLTTVEQKIPLDQLLHALRPAKNIVGLHLGACSLGQPPILEEILKKTSIDWVAAYDRDVPWLESTMLDLLFWSWIYAGAPRPQRSRRLTPEAACHELYARYNVSRAMGFRVVFRGPGTTGPVSSWDTYTPETS
ncbi:MAG: hypothetical protein GF355_14055 [Candidatus Eisenbacteria bacterium]|nr:hypothetical protein [Candidatus Eisenbacteria bacterium]